MATAKPLTYTPRQALERAQRALVKVAGTEEWIPVFKGDVHALQKRLGGWHRVHVELAGHSPAAAFVTVLPE